MVSIKLKFRPSSIDGREGSLYYQIICKRVVRQIPTHYKIVSDEWNYKSGRLILTSDNCDRTDYLRLLSKCIQRDKQILVKIVSYFTNSGCEFSADSIVDKFLNDTRDLTLYKYAEQIIYKLRCNGQYRTSETYVSVINSVRRFRKGRDVYFAEFDEDLIVAYETYLKAKMLTMNTISFYLKLLRSIYNKAVRDRLIEQSYPFRNVYTSINKTVKRAISLQYIKKIKTLDLSYSPAKSFARDMFLFSFYTRGMSFVDIAYLRRKDVRSGIISYKRKKTGQLLNIRLESCMVDIINKYLSNPNSPYLFNIIKYPYNDVRKQYHNALTLINRSLKIIGRLVGLRTSLSMYVARHSWASIARKEGISLSIISEGMGHDSERTTQIYLSSLDASIIDNANQKIIKLV